MPNKRWEYVVVYQDPKDIASGVTPAKRKECEFECGATTAARALSIAKKDLAAQHKIPATSLIILDIVRNDTPLVSEWA